MPDQTRAAEALSPERIAEIRARRAAITTAPWEADTTEPHDMVIWGTIPADMPVEDREDSDLLIMNMGEPVVRVGEPSGSVAEAEFIAHAPADIADLLADRERLERRVAELTVRPAGIYVASRSTHGPMWRVLRDGGHRIISTWINESGEGETADWPDLWRRCIAEASSAAALILYAPVEDGQLKGALIETGAALANGRPVYFVGDGSARRYSWLAHPAVTECPSVEIALHLAARATPEPSNG